ncbi:chromosome segregation protein SMC [Terribacillus saccharophilus]|uniref:chromosome segregation protein SMC n=1 Tax=Terribacillus saccharophilus TaxID=361277 RepID=UPI000C998564|nr:chromosome segregation protein SMC [Terribacillus goriensis]
MFLKRLETVGFKSFAEKVTLDFVPGVTAVVGPNGSGKSNITDAIRWVLGEQSAKSLRGSKMEDIIFQGSDTRKALNVAEVTLVLDNADQTLPLEYQEVSVTRRVFRSGESQFLINNQSCRLKDIIDLFMDSGLGREAFSIISQGKVEEILSSKPEERRSIFEEAAGVLKYKQRKKKAEYKLAETQENLNRVEDITYEIEGQLEPLREQAAIAKDFLEKKAQLKDVEIGLLVAEIEQLHKEWQAVLQELEVNKRELEVQKQTIGEKEQLLEAEKTELHALDASIDELQASLLIVTQELENLEGKKQLLNERSKHLAENKEKLEKDTEQLGITLEQQLKQLDLEQAALDALDTENKAIKSDLRSLDKQLSRTQEDLSEQIEEKKSDYIDLLNEQAAKRNETNSLKQQLTGIDAKKERQRTKYKDVVSNRDEISEKREQLSESLKGATEAREQAEEKADSLRMEAAQKREQYQEAQSKLYTGYQHIEKLRSKQEMLQEMKEEFQGFFQGVKAVLKARQDQKLEGIEGAVIELIDVPTAYVTAMETALGGQAQHIVVDTEASARQAINWLKQTHNGRATFLPLSSIQPKQIPANVLGNASNREGFIGIAADLIQVDPQYKRAVDFLLGNVVIAEDLQHANAIAAALGRRYRVVTLTGDVVNPGGSMTGGAQKRNSQSLFTREKEMQEVTEKLSDFQARTEVFERKVAQLKEELQQLETSAEETRHSLKQLQESEQELQAAFTETSIRFMHANDNLTMYDQDNAQYDTEREEVEKRIEQLQAELASLDQQLQDIQWEISELTEAHQAWQQTKEIKREEQQALQIRSAESLAKLENQQQRLSEFTEQLELTQQKYDEQQRVLQQMAEVGEKGQTEEEIAELITVKQQHKQQTTTLIEERKAERQERYDWVQQEELSVKEANRLHQNLVQQVQDQEVRSNRLDVELENRLMNLQQSYSLTFEKALATFGRAEDIETARTEVKLIMRAISELGSVNVGAIEEFDRINERYSFLTEQKDDLYQAKSTLLAVIDEMDEEMKRLFEDVFNKIKTEFTEVFRSLFGGGHAELKLTDSDNLLETGVDIIAQPPGKKLQNLGLLSGGERALTAIALLFAILRVRPVPFCILDEVEAALDDANVSRFAQYMKQFSEKTQFIAITHRKGTMEEADVLYGVTMQESGVSRLVSVRLEDAPTLVKV